MSEREQVSPPVLTPNRISIGTPPKALLNLFVKEHSFVMTVLKWLGNTLVVISFISLPLNFMAWVNINYRNATLGTNEPTPDIWGIFTDLLTLGLFIKLVLYVRDLSIDVAALRHEAAPAIEALSKVKPASKSPKPKTDAN